MSLHCKIVTALTSVLLALWAPAGSAQVLSSWNDGAAKQAITKFVADVTTPGSHDFVPIEERIAVFDNDGTLWIEQPIYVQFVFLMDQLKAAAGKHPEWKSNPVFRALVAHDQKALASLGIKPVMELLGAANSGMSTADYDESIKRWLSTAKDPRFDAPYTDLVYLPMLELLAYLRSNGFKTFIVSGGTIEFMRAWAGQTYGIPPEQVIGSITDVAYSVADGRPVLTRQPHIAFLDDGPGKPVGIYRAIGRQPIFAFGNSDGDLQMLQWTQGGAGRHFVGLVHHTDSAREWAYDRQSKIGTLDKALDAAAMNGWTVVDMKNDWNKVFAFQ